MNLSQTLIAILFPFIYITLLTGLFVYIFRKKYNFQTLLPVALITTTLFVFLLTVLTHNINIGFGITVLAALATIPLVIIDKDRVRVLKELVFTPGFIILSGLYIFLILLNWFKIIPLLSDSSMHWAPHVWTMWLRDDFYTSPGMSIVIHGDYPPIVQLFELLWLKAAGVYREALLFTAIQVLSFSMLFPTISKLNWRKQHIGRTLVLIPALLAAFISIPLIFFVSDFYSTLEVDAILGFVFAYGVYTAVTESKEISKNSLIKLSLIIAFLCLVKQIAILLAALVIIVYIISLISHNKVNLKTIFHDKQHYLQQIRRHKRLVPIVLVAAVFPLFCLMLWSLQTVNYSSPDIGVAVFHLDPTDTFEIPEILTGDSGSEAQQVFSKTFIKHVLLDPAGLVLNNISSVSYIQFVLLFIGLMSLIYFMNKAPTDRRIIFLLCTTIVAGWFLYIFAIYSVFLFGGMKGVELSDLNTTNRYLRTYLFAMLLIVIMLLLKKIVDSTAINYKSKSVLYFYAILIILFGLFFNKTTLEGFGLQSISDHRTELSSLNIYTTKVNMQKIADISGGTFENPAKILVTSSSDKERHYLQYSALPNRITVLYFEGEPSQATTCYKLKTNHFFITGYKYLDQNNWDMVKSCFVEGTDIQENSVYKIIHDQDKLSLEPISN